MPRRNLYLMLVVAFVSMLCYQKANSAYRTRYGQMFGTFTEVMREIDLQYLEPVDDQKLFEGAMQGMVGELDDYSAYIPPQQAQEFREDLEGEFGGIGIEVTWDRDTRTLTVMNPLVGTPAYEAGVLAGDIIVAINGESTEEFTLEDAVRRLRGAPGEKVRLSVLHEGAEEPVELTITRAIIHVDSVLGDTRTEKGWDYFLQEDSRIGYVRLTTFGEHTEDELKQAMAELQAGGMQALVLDLRNNSGGLLTAGISTCDLFIKQGRIVSTRGRGGVMINSFDASGTAPYTDFPMAVLVNRFSASASEIVAACLQDHHRAVIVGQRTWGKGTVQNVTRVDDGRSLLKLTIASYWRPSNKNIHRSKDETEEDDWGVVPDPSFDVALTDEQMLSVMRLRRQRDVLKSSRQQSSEVAGNPPSAETNAPEDTEPNAASADSPADEDSAEKAEELTVDPQLQRAVEYLQEQLAADSAGPRAA